MMRIVHTKRARQDLIDIWRYVAEDDPKAADGVLDAIQAKYQLLAAHPFLGPLRDDIRPGLRYLPIGQYLLLYQVDEAVVRIVRVVHGRRDLYGIFSP